ncbi:MAG: hypothetical protein U0T83_00130 [Bacteriovoracaceae bacterium]
MKKFNAVIVIVALAYIVFDFNAHAEATKTDCKAMDSSSRKLTKTINESKEEAKKNTKAQ